MPIRQRLARLLKARLWNRLALLIAVATVFIGLVGLDALSLVVAALAFALVVLVTVAVPDAGELTGSGIAARTSAGPAFADAVRLFADALPEPCIILDNRSVIVHRNPATVQQFPGVTEGTPLAFSLRFPPLLTAIETARRRHQPQTVEMHQTVPTETWHKVAISPLSQGTAAGEGLLVITMQSLTEERRLESLRSDFIANASHELRTPLTSLVGFIDTLLGPAAKDAEARTRFLTIMRGQAARMSKLIEDLLSLSRIEMRQHVRPTGQVELTGLLREVSEGLHALAEESGVALNLDLPAEPVSVLGDRDELYEVFENLIDNAIKYGAEGGKVDLVVGPATGRHGYDVAIAITDYGPGVEAAHVPRLTERFYRVDAESSRKKKGTGLGLAIVKHILTRHHGLLSIRSQPGEGTRVEVLLRK